MFASIFTAAQAADLAVPIDGPPVNVVATKPGQPLRFTFRAKAGEHLGLGVSGLKLEPASASGIGLTVKQPDGSAVRGVEFLYCLPSNPEGACDGEFTVTQSGDHVIDVDAPFSAAPRFSIQLSRPVVGTLAVGKSESVTLSRTGQDGRFALAIAPGEDVSLELGGVASSRKDARFALRVYRPDGSLLGEADADSRRGASVALGSAAVPGTYVVEVDPSHGATGAFVIAAKAVAKSAEGAVDIASPVGQAVRFTFSARAGQSVSVGLDNISHAPDVDSNSVLAIVKPDGSRLAGLGCRTVTQGGRTPCRVFAPNLEAGNYTIVVTPPPGASVAGKLYRTTDIAAKLDPARPNRVETLPGQVARFTFAANAGDKVGVKLARVVPGDRTIIYLKLFQPDGNSIYSFSRGLAPGSDATEIEPQALPATGTYTITVDAAFSKASVTFSLIR